MNTVDDTLVAEYWRLLGERSDAVARELEQRASEEARRVEAVAAVEELDTMVRGLAVFLRRQGHEVPEIPLVNVARVIATGTPSADPDAAYGGTVLIPGEDGVMVDVTDRVVRG